MTDVCSVCNKPAVYEIKDAPKDKGNLACEDCRILWPFSPAHRLDGDHTRG